MLDEVHDLVELSAICIDEPRLAPRLLSKARRTRVGDPDLDGTQATPAQVSPMGRDPLADLGCTHRSILHDTFHVTPSLRSFKDDGALRHPQQETSYP